ncbi:MAG: C10 family peptidase [Bacteroidales bacterium]
MKKIFSLALLLFFAFYAFSLPVTQSAAKKVAVNHYFEKGSQFYQFSKDDISITDYHPLTFENETLIHIFQINNDQGYVLVSAESNVIPVLGYSFEGRFRTANIPENIQSWINAYLEEIHQVRTSNIPATEEILNQWNHYSAEVFHPEKSVKAVNPLLTTNWDQGCYYNALCPSAAGGDCNHVWVGCVATAMGMVMKYHNYPEQGTGSHTYNHSVYGAQTANFGATSYNWSAMPNQLYSQNNSVATLLYHCGVSVNMNYGTSGSGAYTQDVRDALVNYFSYGSTTQYVQKMWYSSSGWENLLRNELDSHQPIVYSGQDPSFGHAFVCDGYQGTNYFHFNWGWSGWNNGYFYVSNLNSGNGTFNTSQAAVVHIAPAPAGPLPSFNVSLSQFCAETTVQFHDNTSGTPTSWNWEFPGGNPSTSTLQEPYVTYNIPGNYDVFLTVSDGINNNTLTKEDYIKVKTKPYALFPSDTTICCNNTILLDAGNPGSTYIWSDGNSTQTIVADSSGSGIGQKLFHVEILTSEGCWNKDSVMVTFAACSGMSELDNRFSMYPNPAEGSLFIKTDRLSNQTTTIKVFSEQGLLVLEAMKNLSNSPWQFDISTLTAGVYILTLEIDQQIIYKKLIIK